MNIYINNIRINVLSDAASLNVGTTLNMVRHRSKGPNEGRFQQSTESGPGGEVPKEVEGYDPVHTPHPPEV